MALSEPRTLGVYHCNNLLLTCKNVLGLSCAMCTRVGRSCGIPLAVGHFPPLMTRSILLNYWDLRDLNLARYEKLF
jgi:hypothetical protein